MHVNLFDPYRFRNSAIHRLTPIVKVAVTVLFIFSNVLLPDGAWLAFALSWGMVLAISALSNLGIGYAFKRSFLALPFALAAISVIFALPGRPVGVWEVGAWRLVASDTGVLRFVSILIRSWLSVQVAILLAATIQFPDLIHALRHLRLPGILIAVIAFMYRYLFVLTDEAVHLLRAREARSARLPGQDAGGSIAWQARIAGNMAGQLFLRSYERSDRIYAAMLARGYTGQLLTLNPHKMRLHDWSVGTVAFLALLLIQLIARL